MKKIYLLFILLIALLFTTSVKSQGLSDQGSFGAGLQFNSLFYGASVKYNVTEVHTGEVIVGGGNYGFGGNFSTFTLTGRYLYNFKNENNYRLYGFGQLGYWTVKYDDNFFGTGTFKDTSIAYGVGGGIEYAFNGFEQLGFNLDIGYGGGSFGNSLNYSGLIFGVGIHYYF